MPVDNNEHQRTADISPIYTCINIVRYTIARDNGFLIATYKLSGLGI